MQRIEWHLHRIYHARNYIIHDASDNEQLNQELVINLNMFRKAAINFIKQFKSQTDSTRAVSNIMFDCFLDPKLILRVVGKN